MGNKILLPTLSWKNSAYLDSHPQDSFKAFSFQSLMRQGAGKRVGVFILCVVWVWSGDSLVRDELTLFMPTPKSEMRIGLANPKKMIIIIIRVVPMV